MADITVSRKGTLPSLDGEGGARSEPGGVTAALAPPPARIRSPPPPPGGRSATHDAAFQETAGDISRPTAWLITDGKIGDEVPMRGLADAMGLTAEPHIVRPRKLFAALAPWGPADPWDVNRICHAREGGHPDAAFLDSRIGGNDSGVIPVFPPIAFAAGRRTVPILRALKRASPGTFTVFLGHPRTRWHGADAIWAPAHDGLSGPEIVTSLTAPHPYGPAALASLRDRPDPRVAALPKPLAGLLIGGTSRHHTFGPAEIEALVAAVCAIHAQGFSIAATTSRRTPVALVERLRASLSGNPSAFLWTGEGDNPYGSILACADALLVTADSTNMVSEAVATTAPVHVFEPAGGHPRLTRLLNDLIAAERVRRWAGALKFWPVQPLDATTQIASELAQRYLAFQQARSSGVVESVADH